MGLQEQGEDAEQGDVFQTFAHVEEQGMMSTVGSLGALLLWGIDEGLTQIDKCSTMFDACLPRRLLPAFSRAGTSGAQM